MTIEEIATMLKLTPLTIYRYIKQKKLTAYKLGKEYRVSEEQLQTFLENNQTKND